MGRQIFLIELLIIPGHRTYCFSTYTSYKGKEVTSSEGKVTEVNTAPCSLNGATDNGQATDISLPKFIIMSKTPHIFFALL